MVLNVTRKKDQVKAQVQIQAQVQVQVQNFIIDLKMGF